MGSGRSQPLKDDKALQASKSKEEKFLELIREAKVSRGGMQLTLYSKKDDYIIAHYGGKEKFLQYREFRQQLFINHLQEYKGGTHSGGSFLGEGQAITKVDDITMVFNGTFENDMFVKGEVSFSNGLLIDGFFKHNCAYGQCKIVHPDRSRYIGEVKYDLKHGFGIYELIDGSSYEGYFSGDVPNGEGKLVNKQEGVTYKGTFFLNKRHGKGRLEWENGDFYSGQWVNDLMHGEGTFHKNGCYIYKGDYVKGIREGTGNEKNLVEGWSYNGQWKDGFFEGKGVFTDPSDCKYIGEFRKGLKKGSFRVKPVEGEEYDKTFN